MSENKPALIHISHLNKNYGSLAALKDFSVDISSGGIVGLLGPNGSGKTTLIKILNGLLKDYSGEVLINGHQPDAYTKSIVSYLPDEPSFAGWMKAKDAIHLFQDMYADFDLDTCHKLMQRMGLQEEMPVKEMSKGMKDKFSLVLVMSRKAMIYILDEPIGGVDPATRELIMDTILSNYSENSLILFSTHLISDIERVFDKVLLIRNGEKVVFQDAEELRQEQKESVNDYFKEIFKC
ncbi:MAG: ABC transporter ATP-binding protein [Solobacterium sp.]|jgi:ABC-2 type transport system ATP-binding protein|nr:ABC transporter ATP-binding protein [Solobacterium sp.]MCH4223209.1 ABC transporter ATP-binding protein [Solobacterium sp.]MCH4266077.1 ABC transporter ATP-binding protein [Solobacterium sp.]